MDDEDYQMFKIVVIGDSGSGKTNLTTRFIRNEYSEGSKATVGVEFLAKVMKLHNAQVKITFWDTAGQERYKSLSKVYYKGAAGIIIVYDVTNPTSYSNVESWMRLANQNLNINEVKIIVVGNKVDDTENRKISSETAKADYKDRFDIECFEASAKTGFGVQQSIMHLVESIFAMNSKIKGSQMPFNQDEDDQDAANDYGSVVEPNRTSKVPVKEDQNIAVSNTDAFKKSKNTDATSGTNQSAQNTAAQTDKKSKPTKHSKPAEKGTRLSTSTVNKPNKKKSCC